MVHSILNTSTAALGSSSASNGPQLGKSGLVALP
jgi:hypothetical protein